MNLIPWDERIMLRFFSRCSHSDKSKELLLRGANMAAQAIILALLDCRQQQNASSDKNTERPVCSDSLGSSSPPESPRI